MVQTTRTRLQAVGDLTLSNIPEPQEVMMVQAIRKHPSLFGIALLLVAIPFVLKSSGPRWYAALVMLTSPAEVETTLIRGGLDPESVTAAGVASGSVAGIVQNVVDELTADPDLLSGPQADWVAAKQEMQSLERLIRSGRGSEADVDAYQAAQSAFSAAETARAAALDALFEAGVADLGIANADCLGVIRANRDRELPTEFLVVDRTEADWMSLDEALTNERIASQSGTSTSAECATLLAAARSDTDVAAASASCSTNIAAVTTAWNTAIN